MNVYLEEIQPELTPQELEVLEEVGIDNPNDLYALVLAYPSLDDELGVDTTKLSNLSARNVSGAILAVGARIQASGPKIFATGVTEPAGVPAGIGYEVPPRQGAVGGNSRRGNLRGRQGCDFRLPGWGIREQGERGTCVAHALAAAREFRLGAATDLSEQFLFWAAKTLGGDNNPGGDGTRLEFAHVALAQAGVCEDPHWPYAGHVIPGNVTHETPTTPSDAARVAARGNICPTVYAKITVHTRQRAAPA
jgi:hypothetical protein